MEIPQEEDFRCGDTVRRVISAMNGPGDLFVYCSPCCGGSPWQRLNLHLAVKKGWQSTMIRLLGHWDLHWRLWSGFKVAAEHCTSVGAAVIVDWPRGCECWDEPWVNEFLVKHSFKYSYVDVFMYGLVTK